MMWFKLRAEGEKLTFVDVNGTGSEKGEEIRSTFLENLTDYLQDFIPGGLNENGGNVPLQAYYEYEEFQE